METSRSSLAITWLLLAALAYLVYLVLQPFLTPLAWAAVLAVVAYPIHERLSRRWGKSRSAAATTFLTAVVVIVPAVALISAFVAETLEVAGNIQAAFAEGRFGWVERAWTAVRGRFPATSNVDVATVGANALRGAAGFLMAQSSSIFRNVAGFVVDLMLALFATFFLLRDVDTIMGTIRQLLPMTAESREDLIHRTRDLISAVVSSALMVAGLQGLLGGVAFAVLGLGAPVFWGVVMAFFCLLPFGAWVVWVPAAVVLAVGGETTRALILVIVGVGIISMADNVVRPLLLSGRTRMNGLVVFVSLLGGLNVFGLLGLVLGPILVVTALALLTTYVGTTSIDSTAGSTPQS